MIMFVHAFHRSSSSSAGGIGDKPSGSDRARGWTMFDGNTREPHGIISNPVTELDDSGFRRAGITPIPGHAHREEAPPEDEPRLTDLFVQEPAKSTV